MKKYLKNLLLVALATISVFSSVSLGVFINKYAQKPGQSFGAYLAQTDQAIRQGINEVFSTFGITVSVEDKKKSLTKFGRNPNVGTASTGYTIWYTGQDQAHETYVNRNLIDSVSSSNSSDTMDISIEGHTVGSDISVSTLTQTSGTATLTTGSSHGYSTDDWVYIEGANETEYNGIVQITVTGGTTFTYEVDSGATSPATGTITTTNQNKTFVIQTATLTGQTRAALSTPLARITRIEVPEQNRAVTNTGEVYGYENTSLTSGKPTDTTKIHITVPAGVGQSQKASTALSSTDFMFVSRFSSGYLEKTGTNVADVEIQVRELGGVWRPLANPIVISTGFELERNFNPYKTIPANADIRLVAKSSTSGQEITGDFAGYLAIEQ